ncbi:carbamoylphosphate synthase large subunit short form [Spirochaetia bacterium]|nr:carbamoylphosphate synthase large subunit short form [Spirochaetia bacterium]
MPVINVLVFPAGEQNSIELHDALCSCVNIKLFGASSAGRERHGSYIFENYISGLPLITSPVFLDAFNAILEQNKIDAVFPTHDTVVQYFADNANLIHAKIIGAGKETAAICRDKKKIYETFREYAFIPDTYEKITHFPVFIKPREGQGAVGAKALFCTEDIPQNINLDEYVVCEYLPEEEYTVDCFTDRHGQLLFVSPRSRERLLAGICVSGSTEKVTAEIKNIAETINSKLRFLGLWYFQIKKDGNEVFKLLEISARTAGTICLTRARGINLPLLSVYAVMGYDVEIPANQYTVMMDRALIARYKINYEYDTVYFDFDDTLIIRGKVNLSAIRFLYQCKNKNKQVILLTRHEKNIYESMKKYAINEDLFSEIINVGETGKKSAFVNREKAVFVDNAYSERKDVYNVCKIPAFDVDGIEVLMDWRM